MSPINVPAVNFMVDPETQSILIAITAESERLNAEWPELQAKLNELRSTPLENWSAEHEAVSDRLRAAKVKLLSRELTARNQLAEALDRLPACAGTARRENFEAWGEVKSRVLGGLKSLGFVPINQPCTLESFANAHPDVVACDRRDTSLLKFDTNPHREANDRAIGLCRSELTKLRSASLAALN